jgi:LPXTG-motif cell wall-anchored protein
VLLRADGVVVGTASLAGGGATFSATAPARRGAMTLTATYLGDGAFPPAVSAPVVVAVKAGDPSSVAPIPALSPATLAGLAGLVALIGLLSRRRRRR